MSTHGPDLAGTLAANCHKCGEPLTAGSPSLEFCSETCQAAWLADHTAGPPTD